MSDEADEGDSDEAANHRSMVERQGNRSTGQDETDSVVRSLEASFTAIRRSGPAYHPIFDKFEPEHVAQFLDHSRERDRDEARFNRSGRWFRVLYTAIGIGVFVFLTALLLPEQSDLYYKLLQGLGVFGAGLAGGYGLRTYQERRSQ